MFLLDSLVLGGLRFVLDNIIAATEVEIHDEGEVLREQLLEAQMRVELGELTDAEFATIERDILARLRELGGQPEGLSILSKAVKVTGVEVTVADELNHPARCNEASPQPAESGPADRRIFVTRRPLRGRH